MERGEWKDVADETKQVTEEPKQVAEEPKEEFKGSPELPTLSEAMNKALKDGYTESFKVSSKGLTTAEDKDTTCFSPGQIRITNFYRFEGHSDPQDNCILYLVQTDDGRKGTLVDAYGVYSDTKVSEFVKAVEDIQKKAKPEPSIQNTKAEPSIESK